MRRRRSSTSLRIHSLFLNTRKMKAIAELSRIRPKIAAYPAARPEQMRAGSVEEKKCHEERSSR